MRFLSSIAGQGWDTLVQSKQGSREISRKPGSFSPWPKLKSLRKQVALGWQITTTSLTALMAIWILLWKLLSYPQALYNIYMYIHIYIYIYLYTVFKKPKLIIIRTLNNVFPGSYIRQCMSRLLPKLGRQPGSKCKHLIPSHPSCLTIPSIPQTAPIVWFLKSCVV